MYVFDITYLLKASIKVAKKFRVIPPSVFYPPIRVLSPHPCFIPSSVFYPLIRVLFPHPCFIPSSVFYPLIRVLSPHLCFILSSVSISGHPYPCFISTLRKCWFSISLLAILNKFFIFAGSLLPFTLCINISLFFFQQYRLFLSHKQNYQP